MPPLDWVWSPSGSTRYLFCCALIALRAALYLPFPQAIRAASALSAVVG